MPASKKRRAQRSSPAPTKAKDAKMTPRPPKSLHSWQGTLTQEAAVWHDTSEPPTLLDALATLVIVSLAVFAVCVPFLLITILLMSLVGEGRWWDRLLAASLEPVLWIAIAGTGVMAGAIIAGLGLAPRTIRFEFNTRERRFHQTTGKVFGRRSTWSASFDDIVAIQPLFTTSHATAGSFRMTVRRPDGNESWLDLGHQIPGRRLDEQLEWVRQHVGDVVQPELRLDL